VKANRLRPRGKGPGRAKGHEPAHRPVPKEIDQHLEVPVLAGPTLSETDADRIAKRLRRHAQEFTVFLWDQTVPADNNAAERALRPAVVMRKITGGSRGERGAQATAVLMSVLKTASQQERPLFDTLKTLMMNTWAGKNPGLLTDALSNTS